MTNILKVLVPILVLIVFHGPATAKLVVGEAPAEWGSPAGGASEPSVPRGVERPVTYQSVRGGAAAAASGMEIDKLQVIVAAGEFKTITTQDDILRIAVAMPDVADYSVITKREILVTGKKTGITGLNIWMRNRMDNYLVEVIDPTRRKPRQVRMKVRVMEISENASKSLGIDWGTFRHAAAPSVTIGGGQRDQYVVSGSFNQGAARYAPFKKSQPFSQVDPFMALVNALIDSGVIRILSEPEVVALCGERSDVLIGGEIPIPISTTNTGVTITWKEYGIKMQLEPDLDEEERITANVFTEVSTLDFTNGVTLSGVVVPALKITRAASKIHARTGATVFLSGLKSEKDAHTMRGLPGFSRLPPPLNKLFTTKVKERETAELIISVTPYLLEEQ